MEIKPKIVIGLGNPGKEYEKTYHNVGFLFLEYLINKKPTNSELRIENSELFEYLKINGLIFVKPLTFMNESGKAVKKAMKYFKIEPEEILIIHDDSDIELGKYKISFGRGSAGHKGVESIIKTLGAKDFWRLRIGIRPPKKISNIKNQVSRKKAGLAAEAHRAKAGDFVLKKFAKKDLEILNKMFTSLKALIR